MGLRRKRCIVCGSLMTRFENPQRWVCTDIKVHSVAEKRSVGKRGKRQFTAPRTPVVDEKLAATARAILRREQERRGR